jgi:hypothetical protein
MAVLDANLAYFPTDSSTHRDRRVRQTPRGVSVGREESVASFEEVYATDGPRLVTELYAITGSLAEAEDVVQEAFVRAYGRWSKVEALDTPSAWIRRVALNLAMTSGPPASMRRPPHWRRRTRDIRHRSRCEPTGR